MLDPKAFAIESDANGDSAQHFMGYLLLTVVIAGAAVALALGYWHA